MFWNAKSSVPAQFYRRFLGKYCFHLQAYWSNQVNKIGKHQRVSGFSKWDLSTFLRNLKSAYKLIYLRYRISNFYFCKKEREVHFSTHEVTMNIFVTLEFWMLLALTFTQLWKRTSMTSMLMEIKVAPTSRWRRTSNMRIKFHQNASRGSRVQVPYAEWWTEQICLVCVHFTHGWQRKFKIWEVVRHLSHTLRTSFWYQIIFKVR